MFVTMAENGSTCNSFVAIVKVIEFFAQYAWRQRRQETEDAPACFDYLEKIGWIPSELTMTTQIFLSSLPTLIFHREEDALCVSTSVAEQITQHPGADPGKTIKIRHQFQPWNQRLDYRNADVLARDFYVDGMKALSVQHCFQKSQV